MRIYKATIGEKEFKLAVVSKKACMKKGLSGSKKLKEGYGMLFNFKEEQEVTMNMGGMNYPIDMLFLDEGFKVIKAYGMPVDSADVTVQDVAYVVEVNLGEGKGLKGELLDISENALDGGDEKESEDEKGDEKDKIIPSGVNIIVKVSSVPEGMKEVFKRGGTIKPIETDVKSIDGQMQVLDDKGVVLMNIKGMERIFSIEHTDKLYTLAEQVKEGTISSDVLGEEMRSIIDIQNTQATEYVKI